MSAEQAPMELSVEAARQLLESQPGATLLLDVREEVQSFPRITRMDADDGGIIRDHPRDPRERIHRVPAIGK
jgi:hypothetical protein